MNKEYITKILKYMQAINGEIMYKTYVCCFSSLKIVGFHYISLFLSII
jgi:hypothetical protein